MINKEKIAQIIDFWFEKSDLTGPPTPSMNQKRWSATEEMNENIKKTYEQDFVDAREGKLECWK